MRKTVGIEAFMRWALAGELAKGGGAAGVSGVGSAWGRIADLRTYGTVIDRRGAPSGGWFWQGEPHPDAVTAGRALRELAADGYAFDAPGCALAADWVEAAGEAGRRQFVALIEPECAAVLDRYRARDRAAAAGHLIGLVISRAVLGDSVPDRPGEMPQVGYVERDGRPVWYQVVRRRDPLSRKVHDIEVEAVRNPKTHRWPAGAYRRACFRKPVAGELLARADRLLWRAALMELARRLAGRLAGHEVVAGFVKNQPMPPAGCDVVFGSGKPNGNNRINAEQAA
jgi:hypothetical protein